MGNSLTLCALKQGSVRGVLGPVGRVTFFPAIGLCLIVALGAPLRAAAQAVDPATRDALTSLIQCYARGTDEIGDATTNPDPEQAGLAVYQQCFAPGAVFRTWVPGSPFGQKTFPNAALFPPDAEEFGLIAWADFVDTSFRARGFTLTQHVMTNVEVGPVGSDRAWLTAYLNASHVTAAASPGEQSQCVVVGNGYYSMLAQRVGERWVATSLSLVLITFDPVFETGAGCVGP